VLSHIACHSYRNEILNGVVNMLSAVDAYILCILVHSSYSLADVNVFQCSVHPLLISDGVFHLHGDDTSGDDC
jgi:hypothetical protein